MLRSKLEESIRGWHRGFSSKSRADRLRTMRDMCPSKADIETLFPKHAARLQPLFEQADRKLAEEIDVFAARFVEGGEIKRVKSRDIRREPFDTSETKRYAELFRIIPPDVEVFSVTVDKGDVSEGGVNYLYVNDRWVWIRDVYSIPEFLQRDN
jgi:hypothetical protein